MGQFGKTMGERMLEQAMADHRRERRRAMIFLIVALVAGAAMLKYLIWG